MYKPFIDAANHALGKLSQLDVPKLVPSKAEDDHEILFHRNDPSYILQTHQGEKSSRKPDIVVVSKASAMRAGDCGSGDLDTKTSKKPAKKFEWKELRTTLEFKHTKTFSAVPQNYEAKTTNTISEAKKFMKFRREMNTSAREPEADATLPPIGGAMDAQQTTNAGKLSSMSNLCFHTHNCNATGPSNHSEQTNTGTRDRKRPSTQAVDDRNLKRSRTESGKLHPVVQNGLYATEMFAAHFVRQSVITYVVESKLIKCCRSPMLLIAHTRRHNLHLVL